MKKNKPSQTALKDTLNIVASGNVTEVEAVFQDVIVSRTSKLFKHRKDGTK